MSKKTVFIQIFYESPTEIYFKCFIWISNHMNTNRFIEILSFEWETAYQSPWGEWNGYVSDEQRLQTNEKGGQFLGIWVLWWLYASDQTGFDWKEASVASWPLLIQSNTDPLTKQGYPHVVRMQQLLNCHPLALWEGICPLQNFLAYCPFSQVVKWAEFGPVFIMIINPSVSIFRHIHNHRIIGFERTSRII